MKAEIRYSVVAIILTIAILLQPLAALPPRFVGSQPFVFVARAEEGATNTVYLPIITTSGTPVATPTPPLGSARFEITTPANGATVAGTVLVAIHATGGAPITSVTFKAGNTMLGTDTTPADGLRAFVDARKFTAGALELTATAQSADGETSKKITVQVLPDPPSSGVVNSDGSGFFDSASGGVIGLCPGAAQPGTQISVTELSQEEATTQHKIDWYEAGVTFLGVQKVNASAPLAQSFCNFSTEGYGTYVRAGEAVVNFQLVPDIDGDGVSEMVAINSGNVAPNGAVVAEPIAGIVITSMTVQVNVPSLIASAAQTGLHGKPGDMIKIKATGFNALSPNGNLIIFQSLVTTETVTIAGNISETVATGEQEFEATIPMLPVGAAQVTLKNQGIGKTVGPFALTIDTPNPLTRPKEQVIDELFSNTIKLIEVLPGGSRSKNDLKETLIIKTRSVQADIQELYNRSEPAIQQVLTEQAVILENSGLLNQPFFVAEEVIADQKCVDTASVGCDYDATINISTIRLRPTASILCMTIEEKALRKAQIKRVVIWVTFMVDLLLAIPGADIVGAVAFSLKTQGIAAKALIATLASEREYDVDIAPTFPNCNVSNTPTPPKPTCKPSLAAAGQIITTGGMGALSTSGGSGCGNASAALGGQVTSASTQPPIASQIAVKIYIDNKPTAFTGVTDESGYFYISYIPEGKPFTAIAYDSVSGETRNATGVGPKSGESIRLLFDFTEGEDPNTLRWDGGGDGTSWADAKNWAGDLLPIDASRVIIENAANSTVVITQTVNIRSLQSNAAIVLDKASALIVRGKSTLSNAFSMDYGSGLVADGVNAVFTVSSTTTLDGGELIAVDGGKILLPQATSYFSDVDNTQFYDNSTDNTALNENKLLERIAPCFLVVSFLYEPRRAVCAIGVGSRIELAGVKTLIGKADPGVGMIEYTEVRALKGGFVDLHNLEAISKGHVRFLASRTENGTGNSHINLAQLISTGADGPYFLVGGYGSINLEKLTTLHKATVELYENSQITTTQLSEIRESLVSIDKTAYEFNQVTNIDGSYFTIKSGGKLSFPAVTAYVGTADTIYRQWNIQGKGSQLSLPALETLNGNSGTNSSLQILAAGEATINLSKVKAIPAGHVEISADGPSSLVDLSELTTFLRDGTGYSALKVANSGRVITAKLTELDGVWVILDNGLGIDTAQIIQLIGGGIEATIVSPNLSGLTDIAGSGLIAHSGAKLFLPQITAYSGDGGASSSFYTPIKAEGRGSLIDLANVTTFAGNAFTNDATLISALNGGKINLHSLPTITVGKAQFNASGDGSLIDLASFTRLEMNETGSSWLSVEQKGAIDLKQNTLSLRNADLKLQASGVISLAALTLELNSLLIGDGTLPGNVTNQSTIAPDQLTGFLRINGNFIQTASGKLAVEIKGKIAGTLFDQIVVSGNAQLAGELDLSLLNNYRPALGDTFEVIKANSLTGTFSTVTGVEIGNGKKFSLVYTNSGVTLQVVAAQ